MSKLVIKSSLSCLGPQSGPDARRLFRRLTDNGVQATRVRHVVLVFLQVLRPEACHKTLDDVHTCLAGIFEAHHIDGNVRSELTIAPEPLPFVA